MIQQELLGKNAQQVSAEHIFDAGTVAITKALLLYDEIVPTLDNLLDERITNNQRIEIFAYATIIVILLIVLYLFVGFYTSVITSIQSLVSATTDIAFGKFNRRVTLTSKDEMNDIAEGFNNMAEILQVKEEHEKDQLEILRQSADIKDRVSRLCDYVSKVAEGDLTVQLTDDGNDDLARLSRNLKLMVKRLAEITTEIGKASQAILVAVADTSTAISSQASAANEQAAAVNQTTSSMMQIKQISKQSLIKAQAVGDSADKIQQESATGLKEVEDAVKGMDEISNRMEDIARTIIALSEQSQQISEITDAVSMLAKKSKMLALNASIEAAKAGEAGKGFAVVAAEVKDMAEQSQQSTAQVLKILQDIRAAADRAVMVTESGSKGVETGIARVMRTGDAVRNLSEVIQQSAKVSRQIVSAVDQEAESLDQVYSAMREINISTEQFVASTRQTEKTNKDMAVLANTLSQCVSVYKL